MSERDRQNPYDRSQQQRGGYRNNESYDSPRQANQWQSEDQPQQGGYWQQDSSGRGSDDADREYRFSGESNASYDAGYQSRSDRNEQPRGYQQERYAQGGQQSRDWQDRGQSGDQYANSYGRGRSESGLYDRAPSREPYDRYSQDRGQQGGASSRYGQQQQRSTPYAGRNFDASGGNSFESFTSEDFGGRDFSNRGGVSGGMRSSESYRPTYSVSRLFDHDDDDRGTSRGYGQGRSGEDRGFLQRAGDEVASWFGDESASRRREQDHRGRGPSNYTRSDERIREDANDHLTHDWGVDATNITVSVSNGELTLDGTVDSRQAKRRAEDAVEHIPGVKHVQNNLRVQEHSASYGGANAYGSSGSSYGQSGSGQGTASTGQSGTSSNYSSGSGGSTTATGASASGSTGATTGTGANTTSGIGSTATAGVSNASTARSSDKTN
jgi:osmotically-inducible protein OsmY